MSSLADRSNALPATPMRSLTVLNRACGDVTVMWTADQDESMEAIIQAQMDKGMTFMILEPQMGGLVAPAKRPLNKASEARLHRALSMSNETWDAMLKGGASVVSTPIEVTEAANDKAGRPRRAKTAKEAAQSSTVALPRAVGG